MAKIACKGMALQQDIATVYTTVAQVTSISIDGTEDVTVDSTDLGTSFWKEYTNAGFTEPGTLTAELFYDPSLSGHQTLTDCIGTGSGESWKVSYPTPSSATEQSFSSAGQGFSANGSVGELVRGTFTAQLTGNPGWPT